MQISFEGVFKYNEAATEKLEATEMEMKYRGTTHLAKGNKSRVETTGETKIKLKEGEGSATNSLVSISNGTKTKTVTIAGDQKPEKSEVDTPRNANNSIAAVASRAGMLHANAAAGTSTLAKGEEQCAVASFSFGKKEQIGGRAAQRINYTLALANEPGAGRKSIDASVWLDVETNLPVKRVLKYNAFDSYEILETYTIRLNALVVTDKFELPAEKQPTTNKPVEPEASDPPPAAIQKTGIGEEKREKNKPETAEELYRGMEQKIVAAKSLQCKVDMHVERGGPAERIKGSLHVSEGNKVQFRLAMLIYGEKNEEKTSEITSDGKMMRFRLESPESQDGVTPESYGEIIKCGFSRAGYLVSSIYGAGSPEGKPDDLYSISEFHFAKKEKLGDREVQVVECMFTLKLPGNAPTTLTTTLWIDPTTHLPVKRGIEGKLGGLELKLTERLPFPDSLCTQRA